MRTRELIRAVAAAHRALRVAAACSLLAVPAAAQCLEASLFPPPSAGAVSGGWHFGAAVDVGGDRLIVGAPGAPDDPLAQSGFGLYERAGDDWSLVLDAFARFGDADAGCDVALSGDWAAVGVPRIDSSPAAPGQVLVLRRVAGGWRHVQTLSGESGFGEEFGLSVDLDGGLLAVGMRSDVAGAAHVFRLAGDTWVLDELVVSPGVSGDGFGRAVAVLDAPDAPRLIVGAPDHDVFGSGAGGDGAARVFLRGATGWTPIALLPSFLPGAQLGASAALSADFAVAGGPQADAGSFVDEGLCVVARWDGATYSGAVPIPGTSGSLAGWSLAADDARFYFGCPGWGGMFGEQPGAGLARGYELEPGGPAWELWPNSAAIGIAPTGALAAGDGLGRAIAVDGARLVCGAPGHDGTLADTGAVWIFDLSVPAWTWDEFSIEGALGPSGTAPLSGDGSLCAGDGLALHLHHALPDTPVALVVGLSRLDAPLLGGTLIPSPDAIVWLQTDAAGDLSIAAALPRELPAGTELWMHAWWPDAGGPQGYAASNAIHGLTH